MSKLDVVYEVWENIEETYRKKGQGVSKIDFIRNLTSPASITKTRKIVMSDFVENDENVDKCNRLFRAMEIAADRVKAGYDEPESLHDFVWDENYADSLNTDDYLLFITEDYEKIVPVLQKGLCRNFYTIENGIAASHILDPKEKHFVYFDSETDVLLWLQQKEKDAGKHNSFVTCVYAYLMNALKLKQNVYPLTFVAKNKANSLCNVEECQKLELDDEFITISKRRFKCNATVWQSVLKNDFRMESVCFCEWI
jgi:Na+/serine symporter